MFQITEFIEATMASVANRIEKHGDEDVPAVSLGIVIEASNTMLDQIDPTIRQALYKAAEGQDDLPGVEPSTPVLRCNSFDTVTLTTAHEGWTLHVDDSLDESAAMQFGGCKVDKFKVDAKQGGSIELRFRVGTSDVDAKRLGALGMHNGQSIWINLMPPEKAPDAIDGSVEAFEHDHPNATDLFTAGTDAAGDEDGDVPAGEATEVEDDGQVERDGPTEQAELEAGMAASVAAAGLAPKGRRARRGAAVGAME